MAAARHSMCSTAILPDKNLLFCKVNANRAQDKINTDLFLRTSIAESYNDKTLYGALKTLIMPFHGLINAR